MDSSRSSSEVENEQDHERSNSDGTDGEEEVSVNEDVEVIDLASGSESGESCHPSTSVQTDHENNSGSTTPALQSCSSNSSDSNGEATIDKVTQIVCHNGKSEEPQPGTSRKAEVAVAEAGFSAHGILLGERQAKFVDPGNLLLRQVALLTKELAKCRMEQAKKLRQNSVDQKQLVIEILESPEFYNMAVDLPVRNGNMTDYFCRFNQHSDVKSNPAYSAWIQERVLNLLPKVLTVMLTDWVEKSSSQRHHLKAADVLTCRLVCKSWLCSVDKMLQSNENKSGLTIKTVVSSEERIMEMCTTRKLRMSPSPSRALVLYDLPKDGYAFALDIGTLLALFGRDLTSFTYIEYQGKRDFFGHQPNGWMKRWWRLNNWLTHMPNLAEFHFQLGDPQPRFAGSIVEKRLQQSEAIILQKLPIMANLHTVSFQRVPGIFINTFLTINSGSLKNLSFLSASPDDQLIVYDHHKSLKIAEFSINISQLAQLDAMMCVQWPLRKLTITSNVCPPTPSLMCLPQVFRFLEKFSNTLQQLHLSIGVFPSISNNDVQLNLSKLENLSVCLTESGPLCHRVAYDFILPLATLKQLEVVIADQDDTDQSGNSHSPPSPIIQFKGYLDHMYDSNIWNLFPSLKSIKVRLTQDDNVTAVCKKYKYTKDVYDIYNAPKSH